MTPLREDFDILVHDSGVDVTFKPTKSEYSFAHSPIRKILNGTVLSWTRPQVRHAGTGDTGSYDTAEVAQMAFDVATSAAKTAWG